MFNTCMRQSFSPRNSFAAASVRTRAMLEAAGILACVVLTGDPGGGPGM